MKTLLKIVAAGVAISFPSACATSGNSTTPSTNQGNITSPAQNALQLAVGTATIGVDATVGLNVVATFRNTSGLSAVLADQPTITGPFVVPKGVAGAYGAANVDAGTHHLSASPQVPINNAGLVNSTLGTFTGVFSNGLGPFNSDTNVTFAAYYPGNPNGSGGNGFTSSAYEYTSANCAASPNCFGDATQPQPFFASSTFDYLLGPPAVPFFNDGTFPAGFSGYTPGFTVFEVPPVAGTYSLSVLVPAANTTPATFTQTAKLSSVTPLAPLATPAFTPDSAGGGTGSIAITDSRIIEAMAFIIDAGTSTYYSVPVKIAGATGTFTLPPNLGPCAGKGCSTNSATATSSIVTGNAEPYLVAVVGYDYKAFEAGPPGNTSQHPLSGIGQADLTMSPYLSATYP